MIFFRARIHIDPRHRMQVLRSLTRLIEPTRTVPGCVSCHVYMDIEDDDVLMFEEEWTDEQALADRLRSSDTRVLLSALDCACDPPQVRFDDVGGTKGIEFIAACRKGMQQNG